jgi:hypothetical protein
MISKFLITLFLALSGLAVADLPKKIPLTRYTTLWSNSPFTAKPPPPDAVEAVNPLDDYSLLGVSPISATGYRVTLINKKQPDERITVDSDKSDTSFKILEVIRKSGDPLGTEVRMSSGSMTGKVSFDSKLLVLTPAAPPKPVMNPNGQPVPVMANGQPAPVGQTIVNGQPVPNGQTPVIRQPRPRVIPPPTVQAPAPSAPAAIQNTRPTRHGN